MNEFSPTSEAGAPPKLEIIEHIYAATCAMKEKEPSRNYLGGSRWGEECERMLAYEYHKTPKDAGKGFSGKTYSVFEMGLRLEDWAVKMLRAAGFQVFTHREDGTQFGFKAAKGENGEYRLAGNIDGVVVSGPVFSVFNIDIIYPALWENKLLGQKSFSEVCKKKVRIAKPVYYAQMQAYMAYMGLSMAIFTALNRDSGELYVELVPYDPVTAQEISDKALKIVESQDPRELPRMTGDKNHFKCKHFCNFREKCWSETTTAPNVDVTPGWLNA